MGDKVLFDVKVDEQEQRVLDAFRHIREKEHGEMQTAVKNGRIVKLWTTDKWDLNESPKLREIER